MKKLLLCLVALFAAIGAQAQDGDPTAGRTPQNIYVSPGTIPADNIHFAPNWEKNDNYSYTLSDFGATFVLTDATSLRWQAQFKIPTGVSFTSEDVYQLEFDYKATNSFTGFVKLYKSTDDNTYAVSEELGINTTIQHFKSQVYTNKPLENVLLLFDFGGNPANTTIEVTNIKLIKYVTDEEHIAAPVAEISGITNNSAVLTLTSVPEGTTSVVVSGLGEGKDVNVDLTSKTAKLEGLTANTTYDLTVTAYVNDKNSQSTVSFTTLTAPKEVSMEFIPVNVSDLSALFKIKVNLIDNNQSKEAIHMYLRKASETPVATADDPYAIYGEEKGTPALDPRSQKEGSNIENPVFFNYTELEPNTDYIATAVVKKEGYTGVTEHPFKTKTLDKAENTISYIENGYFMDGPTVLTELPDGTTKRLVYLASVRYTFTYDRINKELYLTFDTRIRNDEKLPELQSKYKLVYKDDNGNDVTIFGDPNSVKGYKDHYSFVINNQCPDIATLIENKTPLHFTCYTDYKSGGQSYFNGYDYNADETLSDDFGDPADVEWIAYSYKDQQTHNKNRYDLYKKEPKTQLMATVVDAKGHYLPRKTVKFEMDTKDEGKAKVTGEEFTDKDGNTQLKWFVEANSLADATNKSVDFEVVAYHELETAAPADARRRILSADGKRLEAKRGFHYVESDTATGIDDIEADDADAPVRYFDLNGREISEPQKGMFVIRLQGSKATKMIAE